MFTKQNFKKGFVLFLLIASILYLAKDALCEDDITSNCLSHPVIYSNGTMTPRGEYLYPVFLGKSFIYNGYPFYEQQDPDNQWQAQSMPSNGVVLVDWIDWGDNLESRPWTTNSIVRVETVLYKHLQESMTGFEMAYKEGLGVDEMWGTSGKTYDEYFPTVYASDAQITIQYLPVEWTAEALVWDPYSRTWSDSVYYSDDTIVVMDELFTAEINIKGKVIHGCSWNVRKTAKESGPGLYRITMSFGEYTNTVVANAKIMTSTEISAQSEDPQGGVAEVDAQNNLTYIDVLIVPGNGSGSGGNGGNGGGGGKSRSKK